MMLFAKRLGDDQKYKRSCKEKSINMTIDPDIDANQHNRADELVKQLRERACPAGLPYTGTNPEEDHGHTDCWLHHQAADEIERLRSLITEWADADDGDLPFNEKYYECTCDKRFCVAARSLRKAVGR
jgi:hypothetical protein